MRTKGTIMGSAYYQNLLENVLRFLWAKGKITIKQTIEYFQSKIDEYEDKMKRARNRQTRKKYKKKMESYMWHTSEHSYLDYSNLGIGIENVLNHLNGHLIITPTILDSEEEFFESYMRGDLDNSERFDKIEWEFAPNGRKKYRKGDIPPILDWD